MPNQTTEENTKVFAALKDASELYERYVELARLGSAAERMEQQAYDRQPDLDHPLGLVIDTTR